MSFEGNIQNNTELKMFAERLKGSLGVTGLRGHVWIMFLQICSFFITNLGRPKDVKDLLQWLNIQLRI